MGDYLDDIFGLTGPIARGMGPAYELRPGQVELARAVERALTERRCLAGEGPVGVGKGQAYLVPAAKAVAERRQRVCVSTAGIALQTQLLDKDLPFLRQVLPWSFTFAVLKGRGNYACGREWMVNASRLEAYTRGSDDVIADQARRLDDWVTRAFEAIDDDDPAIRGDRAELGFVPAPDLWRLLACRGKCRGKKGQISTPCFAARSREVAKRGDIVVVNHHVLMCHLKLKEATGADLIARAGAEDDPRPAFDALICDEAHELPDVCRGFFGFEIAERAVIRALRGASRALQSLPRTHLELLGEGEMRSGAFFELARRRARGGGREEGGGALTPGGLARPDRLLWILREAARWISEALAAVEPEDEDGDGDAEDDFDEIEGRDDGDPKRVRTRLLNLASRIDETCRADDAEKVYYVEAGKIPGSTKIGARMIRVDGILRPFFEEVGRVVLTSATLAVPGDPGGPFAFLRREMGLPVGALEAIVASPFDMTRQSMFVVPDDDALPPDPRFFESKDDLKVKLFDAEAEILARLADICGGRTLAVFTSYAHMEAMRDRLRGKIPFRVLCQGDAPVPELIARFKQDDGSVLLGVRSFWQGVDIPGDALTAVAVFRLPHPHAGDPVVEALKARDVRAGKPEFRAWLDHALPRSLIHWRQMVGRLIRSKTDVGALVVMDRRILTKGSYGMRFFTCLPEINQPASSIEAIGPFLEQARADVRGS